MKPYLRAGLNWLRLFWIRMIQRRDVKAYGLQLFSTCTIIQVSSGGGLVLGDKIISDGRCSLIVTNQGKLEIGRGVYFNEGTMISCKSHICIGDGVLLGPGVKIFDNDHCFNAKDGVLTSHKSSPITIGDHSWIGANAVILRGTNIGKNCVIGAGTVIKGDIPASSIVTQDRRLSIRSMD